MKIQASILISLQVIKFLHSTLCVANARILSQGVVLTSLLDVTQAIGQSLQRNASGLAQVILHLIDHHDSFREESLVFYLLTTQGAAVGSLLYQSSISVFFVRTLSEN